MYDVHINLDIWESCTEMDPPFLPPGTSEMIVAECLWLPTEEHLSVCVYVCVCARVHACVDGKHSFCSLCSFLLLG